MAPGAMSYTFYLKENDLIEASHFPVTALFNEAANDDLAKFYANLSAGIGSGYNSSVCYFWDELDEYDKANTEHLEGVCIETETNEKVIVSYEQMLAYMKLTSERYCAECPEKEAELAQFIGEFASKYIGS